MYLGMLALVVGVALILGSVGAAVGPLVFWLVLQFVFISYEERAMRSSFGEEYKEYCRRVRMWI
jgi:protein-S-isoprenylcysteine O-methyltransferase Ste14